MSRLLSFARRGWIAPAIVLFWVVTTGWLVCVEAFPDLFLRASVGYKSLLPDDLILTDSWMRILMRDMPVGYSHTQIEVSDGDRARQYVIDSHTVLRLMMMGQPQRVMATASASLDSAYALQEFSFDMVTRGHTMLVKGVRAEGTRFDLEIHTGGDKQTSHIEIPDDAVLYSPMMEMSLSELKPGQQMRIRTFNPLSMSTGDLVIEALRKEVLSLGDAEIDATVLSAQYEGMEILSWVDSEGKMLRQETPFGWTLETCDARTALSLDTRMAGDAELLAAMAVPVSGELLAPEERAELRLRMRGGSVNSSELLSHRQAVEQGSDGSLVVRLSRETLPSSGPAIGDFPDNLGRFLVGTPFVQSDDEAILAKAHEVLGGETNSLRAALTLYQWVNLHVDKVPTASVPSALDVLRSMEGDCNEHTYLFVALARAAGLPSKIVVGLVYHEGAFYYHAWPAVYVGRWLEMDPTLGQPAVDATHLRLLEGEFADQMKLMGIMGRVELDVLE